MNERTIITTVVIILAVLGGFVVCDAAFDDDDEPGDLGAPTWVHSSEPPDGRDGPGRDCHNDDGPVPAIRLSGVPSTLEHFA